DVGQFARQLRQALGFGLLLGERVRMQASTALVLERLMHDCAMFADALCLAVAGEVIAQLAHNVDAIAQRIILAADEPEVLMRGFDRAGADDVNVLRFGACERLLDGLGLLLCHVRLLSELFYASSIAYCVVKVNTLRTSFCE